MDWLRGKNRTWRDGAPVFWLMSTVSVVDSTVTCHLTNAALASRFQPFLEPLITSLIPAAPQRNRQQNNLLPLYRCLNSPAFCTFPPYITNSCFSVWPAENNVAWQQQGQKHGAVSGFILFSV